MAVGWSPQPSATSSSTRRRSRSKNVRKKGDPKNPALASAALLDSIGPAHSAEELRLPMPPTPMGHDADLEGYSDRPHLSSVAERMNELRKAALERGIASIKAPPDRVDRLQARCSSASRRCWSWSASSPTEMADVERRRREEQTEEGY